MSSLLDSLSRTLTASPTRELSVWLLGNVPGLPPLVQTVHLLSIAAIMGSVVLVNLKILGLALPNQPLADLRRRLMPLTWWALPLLAASGSMFVFARPGRYLHNPVFGVKFALLGSAIVLTALHQRISARDATYWEQSTWRGFAGKALAGVSLLLWVAVVMAGRWIAYADYLVPMG